VSFFINSDDLLWRVDMTIVRKINGNQIESCLSDIVSQMFKQYEITVENILSLFNEEKTSQKIYVYEIEIELMNETINNKITHENINGVVKNILTISIPDYNNGLLMQSNINKLASYLTSSLKGNHNSLKQLLPKVVTLTRYDYRNIYPVDNYYLTEKTDGIRAIGMCHENGAYIISDNIIISETKSEKVTIVDGELVNDILYAFDVIVYDNILIYNQPLENRLAVLSDAVKRLTDANLNVKSKHYEQIYNNVEAIIKKVYYKKHPYEIDGLIFVKPGDNYLLTKSYKWKDSCHMTIDFLVKKTPNSIIGTIPFVLKPNHTMYFLFVGINNEMYKSLNLRTCPGYNEIFTDQINGNYFPIQFSVSNAPYAYIYYHPNDSKINIENVVVEFKCISNCSAENSVYIGWEPIKVRNDRKKDLESKTYYGNDYRVAEITWINYMDPFPVEQLWLNYNDDEYFMANKPKIYNAQTSVISFMKSERLMNYKHTNNVLDIGSGKGQDLGRYIKNNIRYLTVIDNDKASLSELIRRKFTFIKNNNLHNVSTNVKVVLADMTENYIQLQEKVHRINKIKYNLIVCNLSLHYYTYTNELLQNFIQFIIHSLDYEGHLVITCMFGEEVFNLLKKLSFGEFWTCHEGEVVKYSIQKLYSSDTFANFGQKIGIILPFSNGQYYEEYLINIKNLIQEFKKYKIEKKINHSVSKIIPDFELKNMNLKLTNDDKTYLSLYGELVFVNKNNK
jgi:SAM-dependent methyltransferase